MIEVKQTADRDPLEFEVVVRERNGETRHHVTMTKDTCERLTKGTHTPERCVERRFGFCSTASRRGQSSAASTSLLSRATSPNSSRSCRAISHALKP